MTTSDAMYRFSNQETAEALACVKEHGFAIIEGLLPISLVETLKEAVHEACDACVPEEGEGSNQYCMQFVEKSPLAIELLKYEPYMHYVRRGLRNEDLCFHRSACIRRSPGDKGIRWHRDTSPLADHESSRNANDVLNRPKHQYEKRGAWFYLTGSRPEHGGLWVIPDSHRPDYQLPMGYEPVAGRKSFKKVGCDEEWCDELNVPGAIPVITNPGDAILFTTETFHAAGPNTIDQTRLSCAIGFRPKSAKIEAPWDWPASAYELAERLPDEMKTFMDGYTSFVPWTAEEAVAS